MDGLVTASADHEGFASPGSHDAYPERLLGPSLRLQVGKFPHMMDCTVGCRGTECTRTCKQSFDELVAPEVDMGRVAIDEFDLFLSS